MIKEGNQFWIDDVYLICGSLQGQCASTPSTAQFPHSSTNAMHVHSCDSARIIFIRPAVYVGILKFEVDWCLDSGHVSAMISLCEICMTSIVLQYDPSECMCDTVCSPVVSCSALSEIG